MNVKLNLSPLVSLGVFVSVFFLSGCGDKSHGDLPAAASHLVDASKDNTKSTLPHTVDTATEFQGAIMSLAPGAAKPEIRETDNGVVTIVRVEKTTGIKPPAQKTGSPAPTPKSASIEQDWSGIVLLPDRTRMSKAYTTDVDLERIEAHPLLDDSLRVWVRVANATSKPLRAQIACNFSDTEQLSSKTDFVPVSLPANGSIDAYFMSPMANVTSYTILVR